MEKIKISTTVLNNIRGSKILTTLREKMKKKKKKKYSITIRSQRETRTLKEVIKMMRENADKGGITPEILADELDVDVETVR